jgi:dual specificity phosphatase 12
MTQIWERLHIGGLADAEELAADNPSCITTVISLCEVPAAAKRRGINYLHVPIEDDEPLLVHQFDAIIDALSENIRWGTVLLHCAQGCSRAPSMAAAYMEAVGCMGIDAAINEIRKVRPFIHPSSTLLESLKEHLR